MFSPSQVSSYIIFDISSDSVNKFYQSDPFIDGQP